MPVCESLKCNAPVIYLLTLTPKGRRKYVTVNPPEKRWIQPLTGTAQFFDTYQRHSETCLDPKGARE